MAREIFKINNKQDYWIANEWIKKKLEGFYFPYYDDVDEYGIKNLRAEESFKALDNEPELINAWCE
ncbi:MAG: hypothetical protein KZQ70_12200 [gamma proteobacterium symbiont of Lucinoma myriamae]|nr:hypothetical protein [gamma proteobacterium symbiont of Lucinoma myriamae]MCU7818731.1 hypothetical protein [gamma proteobacterium symbiont of Lucinoma myriamae]